MTDDDRRARWPRSVFEQGLEPDPRFSLANERTFLAWIRTSLALIAGAVALDLVDVGWPEGIRRVVAVMFALSAAGCAAQALVRWMWVERAVRLQRPLPGGGGLWWLAGATCLVAVVVTVTVGLSG